MRTTALYLSVGTALSLACIDGVAAQGQGLNGQVDRTRDGVVSFTYAARPDACGDGVGTIRINSFTLIQNIGTTMDACTDGPVRVVVTKVGGEIVSLRTVVGPLRDPVEGPDLGRVSGQAAATYLLHLAGTLEGRPGREAILPAVLADSAETTTALLDLAQDRDLSRQVRTTAASWAGRNVDRSPQGGRDVTPVMVRLARDENESTWMRTHAMSVLGRMGHGTGVTELLSLQHSEDLWLAGAALKALANTDDPRGRAALRQVAANRTLNEATRVEAIKGLGRRYTTGGDIRFLREVYSGFETRTAREAIVNMHGQVGGSDNISWLLERARDDGEIPRVRSRAVRAAARAGARSADLGALYDRVDNRQARETVVSELLRIGDTAAIDRLIDIASHEQDQRVRRSLISRMGRSDHPRLRAYLKQVVEEK